MSHSRATSDASIKVPHSISLKVLRLSRPQLTQQFPLPEQTSTSHYPVDPSAALAHPSLHSRKVGDGPSENHFFLSPGLLLPASFGAIFVGSTLTCTLCANNELPDASVAAVSVAAEIQYPGTEEYKSVPLSKAEGVTDERALGPGQTLQRIVSTDLPDEGVYTLAVTVTYKEQDNKAGSLEPSTAIVGRSRTFRKLYQFTAHQLIGVRTKARIVPKRSQEDGIIHWVVEAQLENLSSNIQLVLEDVRMNCLEHYSAKSLNMWDLQSKPGEKDLSSKLGPREVLQAAYLISGPAQVDRSEKSPFNDDGKAYYGQLRITWRAASGESGTLNTSWLGAKVKS